jgi:hypothetical protein
MFFSHRKHDLAVFNKLNTLFNESSLDKMLQRYRGGALSSEDEKALEGFVETTSRIDSRYRHSFLILVTDQLAFEMLRLLSDIRKPSGPALQGGKPYRSESLGHYDIAWHNLRHVWMAFRNYRLAINKQLKV